MAAGRRSRTEAFAERVAAARDEVETLPGAPLVREVLETERDLGGGLIAGGVAFRIFLWLVPFGLVVAALLSFWSEHDQDGLERASREFGGGATAAQAAAEALESSDRNALVVLLFGLVALGWFTLGAVRALVLAHARAWQLKPQRIRRPLRVIAIFNGLFVLYALSSAGLAWLREQLGTTAILGTVAVVFCFAPRLGRAEETYGAFGAAAAMLVRLYVISRLITVAAFLNSTLWLRRHERVST